MSFWLTVLNDSFLLTLPPRCPFALGMDAILLARAKNHVKKLKARKEPMSDAFNTRADGHTSTLSESEGEWVPPPSNLSLLGLPPRGSVGPELDSGDEADTEAEEYRRGLRETTKRPRGDGTRWSGKLR